MNIADTAIRESSLRALEHTCNAGAEPDTKPRAYRSSAMTATEVRTALAAGGLMLAHQPQYDLYTGKIVGAESLARLLLADMSVAYPINFIDALENSPLAGPFSRAVLLLACKQFAEIRASGAPLPYLAVNVSAQQLATDAEFPEFIAQTLENHAMEPGHIEIEITETHGFENAPQGIASVRELAELGIRMMLDDFGYGYATLSSLVDMPISGLKIDRRMVSKLPTSSVARKAVKHILKMANDMGLKVVAEGSQSLQEDIYLSELGCNYGQGFGFSRPVSAEILTELVNCPPMRH